MIKIIKTYLPTKRIVITEHIKNSVKNTIIIECDSRKIFINGYLHTQLYYNDEDINVYAHRIVERINEHKTKIFRE